MSSTERTKPNAAKALTSDADLARLYERQVGLERTVTALGEEVRSTTRASSAAMDDLRRGTSAAIEDLRDAVTASERNIEAKFAQLAERISESRRPDWRQLALGWAILVAMVAALVAPMAVSGRHREAEAARQERAIERDHTSIVELRIEAARQDERLKSLTRSAP